MIDIQDRKFSIIRGSDVERDGMYLEVNEKTSDRERVVIEIFYSDESGKMTFSAFDKDLPFELVETVTGMARESLAPISVTGEAI